MVISRFIQVTTGATIAENDNSFSGAEITGALGGALICGIIGYKYPKAATTLYGIGIGASLGLVLMRLVTKRE